ncbi:MAG: NAD-dependent epimerase/dehydratase family protein [Thermoleophilia bacterium]|jgi:nucleoside-diphosphate-sugar epimerase|nr:NAD-dependent epimerase/dehydratase family protein [Thermoleophilia bacterium]
MSLGREIQTVLVTGATGFVGGAVARRLRSEGCTLRALVRRRSDASALSAAGCEVCRGDVTDAASVREAMDGVDAVVHCAALVSDWGARETFARVNVEGSRHVFDAALRSGVKRVVHFSTADVFGIYPDGRVVDDSFPLKRTGFLYSDTKAEADDMALAYAREQGLPVAVLRPLWVYGPGDRSFLPELVDAMRTRRMVFFGSPRNTIPLCYIDNLVDAVVLALTNDRAVGQGYLVCDGAVVSWRELTDLLADELDLPSVKLTIPLPLANAVAAVAEGLWRAARSTKRPALTRYTLAFLGRDLRYSNGKISRELGFSPRVLPEEGLARSIEWLRSVDLSQVKTK